ncbi:MAG TPA: aminotransferase class III-fold pyridoxal phosphate-dependent enzyme [Solirubrobacteraceae bacterium]|nr:aminotransferase class III-fold pyridoxal phosphate-dependent enzyme [Solirubrobacteraceae bacterium]
MSTGASTATPSNPTEALINDLMAQQWVTDLAALLSERQATSIEMVEQLRSLDASNHVFWPFHAPPFPPVITDAHGCRITDADGNSYLDSYLGFGTQALHGHNPKPVVEFVREQLGTGPGNGYFHPITLRFVKLLHELVPHCEKFALLNSGTDATHAAIRLARAHTGRRRVAKFEGALHGPHDLGSHNMAFWYHGYPTNPFPPSDENGIRPTSAIAGVPAADARDLLVLPHDRDEALALIERHGSELACVIAEPCSSSFPFEDVAIPLVRDTAHACQQLGVPFVLDEVLTGFRCGLGGAAERYGIPADLYCYGKAISGLGIALSALGGRAELLDQMQTSGLSLTDIGSKSFVQTTHGGNFLAVCAAYATLRELHEQRDRYYDETRAKIASVREKLAAARATHDIPLRLVGFGDFVGSFIFAEHESYEHYRDFVSAVNPVALFLMTLMLRARGIFMLSAPMLFTGGAHSQADLDELVAAVIDSAVELKSHGVPLVPAEMVA